MQRAYCVSAFLFFSYLAISCHSTSPESAGWLEIYVFNEQGAEPGKEVALRGTELNQATGENGKVVFEVPAGTHVVRVYEINQGGPCCPYVDHEALVKAGKTTRIAVYDCTTCD